MPNVCKNVVIEPHLAWDLGDRIHYLCGAFCSSVCLQGKPAKTLIFPFLFFSSSKFPVFFFFLTRCTTAFQGFVVSVFRVEQIGAKKKKEKACRAVCWWTTWLWQLFIYLFILNMKTLMTEFSLLTVKIHYALISVLQPIVCERKLKPCGGLRACSTLQPNLKTY